ncbi:rsbT co-antagonist protein RsbR [Neobacillus bataviensis]|uniref:RsbT co-antagonist protein RsbR n=1 Tax=Neobacillus bataviensis TaxID=220685 RepID=A0A561D0H2_9BACI|nr:STAS domain-containing protein [Neobacillus bataviensis]TWD96568.1 rsbT co-antagonist protein RsbR [Neobacillus bataviensis]
MRLDKIAAYFMDNSSLVALQIVEGVLHRMNLVISEEEKQQAIVMYIKFFQYLGQSILEDKEDVPEDLLVWSKQNAEHQVTSGGKISEIAVRYPPTRAVFADLITKLSDDFAISLKEWTTIITKFNSMLDISLNETILAFEKLSEEYKEKTKKELAERSAPVVLIQEAVAVLPLVGEIDSYRASYIVERVVPSISDLQLQYIIIDYSGILHLNQEIARYLKEIGDILVLLGIDVIVTGLRPELAMTVVNSGMDMSAYKTFIHVKRALDWINSKID